MGTRIIDVGLSRLKDDLKELQSLRVFVGYQAPEGTRRYFKIRTKEGRSSRSQMSVAKIAAIQEFGWPEHGIEARSFIRSTLHEQRNRIAAFYTQQVKAVIEGRMRPLEATSKVGELCRDLIREKLDTAAAWAAQLDPETVEAKGFSTPLEETGLLKDSLSWAVRNGKEIVARS